MTLRQFRLTFLLACAVFVACGADHALKVTGIQLGRSLNADGSVAGHTTSFAPSDTVYVSIATSGVGSATIGVRWMYGSRLMGSPTKQVSYRDDAATEFHLQSVSGFPEGDYKVEVLFNGESAGVKEFSVGK